MIRPGTTQADLDQTARRRWFTSMPPRVPAASHRQRERQDWKAASRAFMLRVFHRLTDRGLSMTECAEIWDRPVGARWFPGLIDLAMREAAL